MNDPRSRNRGWVRATIMIAIPVVVLGGCILLDHVDRIPMRAARPPKSMTTIEDFRVWKGPAIKGTGTYEGAGVTYTVVLAPAGRHLASGPSAYLFDPEGRFVDWTSDMGDFPTVRLGFDLTSGRVKNIQREKP